MALGLSQSLSGGTSLRGGLVRLTIGFASRVAAGKERGSAARPFRAQLVQRFGKNSARKPRYPTTRASFRRVIAGCFSVVERIPRSGPRSIRERRTARAFPRGVPRFSCQDLPWRLYFLPRPLGRYLFAGRRDRRLNDSRYSDDKSDNGDNRERPGGSKVGKRKAKTNPF